MFDDPDYSKHWEERFPLWAHGSREWSHQSRSQWTAPARPTPLQFPPRLKKLRIPRLFVSHSSADTAYAKRVAYLAHQAGWDFWVDVFDPSLNLLQTYAGPLTAPVKAAAVASIVEMALINCSHILVVTTGNSNTSRWVPYELGRSRGGPSNSALWIDSGVNRIRPADLAEFYHLVPHFHGTEREIEKWLTSIYHGPVVQWPHGPVPPPLP